MSAAAEVYQLLRGPSVSRISRHQIVERQERFPFVKPRNLIPSEWPTAGHAHPLGDDKGGLEMTCAQCAMLRISQSLDRWFSDQG
jgi:hypothetical protein